MDSCPGRTGEVVDQTWENQIPRETFEEDLMCCALGCARCEESTLAGSPYELE